MTNDLLPDEIDDALAWWRNCPNEQWNSKYAGQIDRLVLAGLESTPNKLAEVDLAWLKFEYTKHLSDEAQIRIVLNILDHMDRKGHLATGKGEDSEFEKAYKEGRLKVRNDLTGNMDTVEPPQPAAPTQIDAGESEAALDNIAAVELIAKWMIHHGFTTGRGDTIEGLLNELSWQIAEIKTEGDDGGHATEQQPPATPTDRVRAALEYVLENNAYIHSQISFYRVQEKLTEALAVMSGMVLVPVEPTSECTVCGKEIPFTKHRGNMQCQKHSHLSF